MNAKCLLVVLLVGLAVMVPSVSAEPQSGQCADPGTPAGLRQISAGASPCAIASKIRLAKPPRPRKSTAHEIARAKAYFANELKDSRTAQWKGWQTWPDGYVCGWVNAKNSFGGYTGWQRVWFFRDTGDVGKDWRRSLPEDLYNPCLDEPS